MPITQSSEVSHEFLLTCIYCDNGEQMETPEQAIAEGWCDIEEDCEGTSWNYLGFCPICMAEEM